MVNHNRDDQKEEEEKQDYSDWIPKKNPSKKFNANWSNDLLQSKQISKKFFYTQIDVISPEVRLIKIL